MITEIISVDLDRLQDSENNIKNAAEIIKRGGLVAFPTETVYGLGGDGTNPDAYPLESAHRERVPNTQRQRSAHL